VVAAPPEAVWSIITDYDNLATHVPNLVTSALRPHPTPGGIRLFQEGAQRIVGAPTRTVPPYQNPSSQSRSPEAHSTI